MRVKIPLDGKTVNRIPVQGKTGCPIKSLNFRGSKFSKS